MTRSTGNPSELHTAPRLFVAAALRDAAEIAATPEQAHYLNTVLRRASGDVVRLFNGTDGEWAARLTVTRRDRVTLTAERRLRVQSAESGPWLVFALLKRDATDLIVRQAVELGASRLLPVITERTNAARVNEARLRAIAIEAAEQSERLTVPEIEPAMRLDAVLDRWPEGRRLFVALERSWTGEPVRDAMPRRSLGGSIDHTDAADGLVRPDPGGDKPRAERANQPDHRAARQVALLVGPEGGFSPAEQEQLRRFDFVTPISLGPFVLRAETAAAAGQALLLGMGWAEYVAPNLKRPSTACPIQ